MEGEFENDRVKYIWQADVEKLEIENLYEITIIVAFEYINRQYGVSVCTRINGEGSSVVIEQNPMPGG